MSLRRPRELKVMIIQNDETEILGLYEVYLRELGAEVSVLHAYRQAPGELFPPVSEYDAFIVGPTPISANAVDDHAFLRSEWSYLSRIIESRKSCLGVCCGGQMLARRLGARVWNCPEKEVGGYEVRLTEVGGVDPLFKGFPTEFPVFHWHSDMFEVPPGGSLLVEGRPCPIQAFRLGNVWGVIFHLEVTSSEAGRWADAYHVELEAVGKTRAQVIRECVEREPEMGELAYRLVDNFLNLSR
jgi:GMP synthase (glutamine-hydrolysing)